ncbi:hypothetical protein Pint_10277 [Pistacia integerrima]|uniref:Uncharacterized protein n=1 Tax=Pistacia integerrima TaxID=434235 RepID=A0ACC0XED8_9ROSI|nr:hypothetical protein Pint_10277 [Pistacia integerrima]
MRLLTSPISGFLINDHACMITIQFFYFQEKTVSLRKSLVIYDSQFSPTNHAQITVY